MFGPLLFQLTAARRRLVEVVTNGKTQKLFQLTAARRRLGKPAENGRQTYWFQLTAARRRLVFKPNFDFPALAVSTHSRPKAAGASAETLAQQGLHRPVSLRFHQKHMALL